METFPIRQTFAALVAALVSVAGVATGCDDEPSESADEAPEADAERESSREDASGLEQKRSAFGLPFPPKIRNIRRLPRGVEVTTEMELEALREFYEARLVDYEVLRPSKLRFRVLGLRDFMPEIRGHRYGSLTYLQYSPSREEPRVDTGTDEDADTGVGRPSVGGPEDREESAREPGTPVELTTDDGELLAPGARWGEPYTPPEDSPLHKPRYRENFGKPFGEWRLP